MRLLISLSCLLLACPAVASDELPTRVQTLPEAMQVAHQLISRVAERFACDSGYEVVATGSADEPEFTTYIFENSNNCRSMLEGLNTWGELYGVRFDIWTRLDLSSDPGYRPSRNDDRALIHEIDPDVDAGDGN